MAPRNRCPVLLVLSSGYRGAPGDAALHALALHAGFRVVVAPWFAVEVGDGVAHLGTGLEPLVEGVRPISDWETVHPAMVLHRMELTAPAVELMSRLSAANPTALLSTAPALTALSTPDGLRQCLSAAAEERWFAAPVDGERSDRRYQRGPVRRLVPLLADLRSARSAPIAEGASETLVGAVARCIASWPMVAEDHRQRLVLLAALHVVDGDDRDEGRAASVDLTPCLTELTGAGESPLGAGLRRWFARLLERCTPTAPLMFPFPLKMVTPDPPATRPLADGAGERCGVLRVASAVAALNDVFERDSLLAALVGLRFVDADGAADGCSFSVRNAGGRPVVDVSIGPGGDLRRLIHPLAGVLPTLGAETGIVATHRFPGAVFRHLDPNLVGPSLVELEDAREECLLAYLGRVIGDGGGDDAGLGARFVEPGVGRTCLVDFLRVDGFPDLLDFSVAGVGLTPYSAGGYVEIGRAIDGRVALVRAMHRLRCASRLEEAGVRTGRVVAVIELTGEDITMPDASSSPAALLVRGFRCALRVKQLDPVACFHHSLQHSALVADAMMDPRWRMPGTVDREPNRSLLGAYFDNYGAAVDDIRQVTGEVTPPADELDATARARRMQLTWWYAPIVLDVVKARLSREIGRDPVSEGLSDREYVNWFATTLGAELAAMRKVRFLHDYHHPGVARYSPGWQYTLVEGNVGLLAEFPDLDTGVFVDAIEQETCDDLQLTRRDLEVLHDGYETFHRQDVEAAHAVLRSLSIIALHHDTSAEQDAASRFWRAYDGPGR